MKIFNLKTLYLFIVLIIPSEPSFSQNKYTSDSLKHLLSYSDLGDSLRFEVLRKLSYADPNPVHALEFGRKALDLSNKLQDSIRQLRALEMISANQRIIGRKAESLETAMNALELAHRLNHKKKIAGLLANIGANLTTDGNYEKAITFLSESAEVYFMLKDYYRLATIYVNIGETYRLSNQLDSAELGFNKALAINDSIDNKVIEAYAIGNLGLVHSAQNNYDLALAELERSIEILTELGDAASVVIYRSEIGEILLEKGKIDLGIELIESSYREARVNGLKEQCRDLSNLLTAVFAEKDEFKTALQYHKIYQSYQDSLLNAENIRSIEQTVARYELDKKEAEIAFQEASLSNEIAEKRMITIILIMLLFVLLVIYLNYRNKLKINKLLLNKNQLIQQQSDEKEFLYREMHHRVKNNLQLISSIMGLNANQAADKETSLALRSSQSRMEAMSLIHNSLYGQDAEANINFDEYLNKLSANLEATYFDQIDQIKFSAPNIVLLADDCIPIGLIINECICNAVKYKSKDRVKIEILFKELNERSYSLSIKDNGPGMKGEGKGFGSELIQTLSAQLGANVQIQSSKEGTEVLLTLNRLIVLNQAISA